MSVAEVAADPSPEMIMAEIGRTLQTMSETLKTMSATTTRIYTNIVKEGTTANRT